MPSSRLLLPGIAVLLAACSGAPAGSSAGSPATPAAVNPTPAPAASDPGSNAPWALTLDLAGDLNGHVTGTAPSDETIRNDCTGGDSARLGSWGSTMLFTVGTRRYALYLLVKNYRGSADFNTGVDVEVASEDGSQVWENQPSDPVTFTVGADQESGLLEAELSAVSDTSHKLDVGGHWSCHP